MTISIDYALRHWSRAVPEQDAVHFEDDAVTYRELDRWVDAAAHHLSDSGISRGDRVAIAGNNSLDWVVLDLAIHRVGAIVVPLNTRLTDSELQISIKESTPAIVAHDDDLKDRITRATRTHPGLSLLPFEEIAALREQDSPEHPTVEVDGDEPSVLVFTSGTTGRPKAVIYTHVSMAMMMYELSLIHDIRLNDHRPLLALPLYTALGVIYSLERTIIHGGTLILEARLDPARALELISQKRVTHMSGPSIFYDRLAQHDDFAEADLSSLRNVDVGGSRVESDTIQKWKEHGVVIRQMYGQTEIGGYGTLNSAELAVKHPEFCGIGGVFTRVRVVDAEGKDTAPGEAGEILLRGPGMTPGYWGRPEATQNTIVDGWIHTGDVGKLDENGNLIYVDRMKDIIISGGLNIAPAEIEEVIERVPGVKEAAVIPVPDAKFQETPAAIVHAVSTVTSEDVINYCNEHLADYKVPRYVVIVDAELPRTPTGKLEKAVLKKQYEDAPKTREKVR